MRSRGQYAGVFLLFVLVQLAALAFAPVLYDLQFQAFENPSDPINPLIYILFMIIATAGLLAMIKYAKDWVVRLLFMLAVLLTMFVVFYAIAVTLTDEWPLNETIPTAISFALVYILWKNPGWIVIDVVGFIVAFGSAAVLGISLGIVPALILLAALAVYDAIAVYKTKHMLKLAEGVSGLRLPILFVIPKNKDFDMRELDDLDLDEKKGGEDRTALMMGVGDAVIPGILVVSAAIFLSETDGPMVYGIDGVLVAIGTLAGAFVGFAFLMKMVSTGKPQAGLPYLNGGAMTGFLLAYLFVFGSLPF
jgi:presenilin-like A22 family membrane protease